MPIVANVDVENIGRVGFEIQTIKCAPKSERGCGEEVPLSQYTLEKRHDKKTGEFICYYRKARCNKCQRKIRVANDIEKAIREGETFDCDNNKAPLVHEGPRRDSREGIFFCRLPPPPLTMELRAARQLRG